MYRRRWAIGVLLAIVPFASCTSGDQPAPAGDIRPPADEVPEPAAAQEIGRVCPDPENPCPGFRERDLSFVLPADTAAEEVIARAEIRSRPFYAVILRSGTSCFPEEERLAVQPLFPRNKVFARDLFECDGEGDPNYLDYTGVSAGVTFLAVFAGTRRDEAEDFLTTAREMNRFPGANLRRMQVVFGFP